MPCYRCGNRQADPEPGKPSPYHRGVVGEHQVLICPACQPAAVADLTRCSGCGGVHLIRRLDQIECLDCRLIREAGSLPASASAKAVPDGDPEMSDAKSASDISDISYMSGGKGSVLADEVARALERMRRTR